MPSKDEVAKNLIDWHFQVEPGTVEIYRIVAPNEEAENEPIKLLEVNTETPETGRVVAFGFGGTDAYPYPTVVAEVTPAELEDVRAGTIPLPDGWNLSSAQRFAAKEKMHAA